MAEAERVAPRHKIILINKREATALINSFVCQLAKLSNSGPYSTHDPSIDIQDPEGDCRYTFSIELPDTI